jgi:lysozyme
MTDEIVVTAWLPLAVKLIQQFEGCKLRAYPDPGTGGDPWTIGWGSTGSDIRPGTVWTQAQADDRMKDDIAHFGRGVLSQIGDAPADAHQIAAMVSLAYNIGLGNFAKSSVLRMHKAGDYAGAQASFGAWNKAAGKVMAGLTRRRAVEAALYGSAA